MEINNGKTDQKNNSYNSKYYYKNTLVPPTNLINAKILNNNN